MAPRPMRAALIALRATLGVTCVATIACGGEAPASSDGGARDAAALSLPVDIPWLADGEPPVAPPELTPCPAGWREVPPDTADAVATCDPYPEGGAQDCGDGEAHFPGEAACAPVGAACPDGDWPAALPFSGVLYVQAGAIAGGAGTIDRPFSTIAAALRVATAGTTVAVAKGTYPEVVHPLPGVTLVGACAAETRVAPRTLPLDGAAVLVARTGVARVVDIGIVGSPRAGLGVVLGASVELAGVEIVSATGVGLLVVEGGHVTAQGVIVRDTRPEPDGTFGDGVRVQDGATVEVTRAVIARNRSTGLLAIGDSSMITLHDVAVRDTEDEPATGSLGSALRAEGGARAVAARAVFERSREVAVVANGAGSTIDLEDVVVRDTRSRAGDGTAGSGVGAAGGAVVRVAKAVVERSREDGVFAAGADTWLELTDVVVRDTDGAETDGAGGWGLGCGLGATVRVSRAAFDRNRGAGITSNGASLYLADVAVRDTLSRTIDLIPARGLDLEGGAIAEVYRAVFARSRDVGVFVAGEGTTATFEDVAVLDTDSAELDGTGGVGIHLQEGGVLAAQRLLVEDSRFGGVLTVDHGSASALENVVVRNVARPRCADTTCPGQQLAVGIGSYDGATSVRRFLIDGAETCGVHLALGGGLDLRGGSVRRSEIGACVQVDGYDVTRLSDAVSFVDVVSTLQATVLPIPSAIPSLQ